MSEQHEAEALTQVVREARGEAPPPVDWQTVESRLIERIRTSEMQPPRSRVPLVAALGALAAAAAVALVFSHAPPRAPSPPLATAVGPSPSVRVLSGGELKLGEVVQAGTDPVRVEHPGRAAWTLAPGSAAHVAAAGRFLTITLETGSVLAEVVPGQATESFAVETRQTRVAAHGTVFRVTLEHERVAVEVTEGEVAIGSAEDDGKTHGFTLRAPDRGTFTLDGARSGHIDETRAPVAAHQRPGARTPPPPLGSATPPALEPEPPPPPTAEDATDEVVARLRSCFAQHTEATSSVHVSATTEITLTFAAGAVSRLSMDPPLAPAVTGCALSEAQSVVGPAGPVTVTREVWLAR